MYRLSEFDTQSLKRSLDFLTKLCDTLSDRVKDGDIADAHTVTFILSYSSLIFNPAAVEHTCQRFNELAIAGVVDMYSINGLAIDSNGDEAGFLVHITVCVHQLQA